MPSSRKESSLLLLEILGQGYEHKAWHADLALLEAEHRKLRKTLVDYTNGKTQRVSLNFLFGIAFHDIYHAGQIRLLRRLRDSKPDSGASGT